LPTNPCASAKVTSPSPTSKPLSPNPP
jgi:hypothetical protein